MGGGLPRHFNLLQVLNLWAEPTNHKKGKGPMGTACEHGAFQVLQLPGSLLPNMQTPYHNRGRLAPTLHCSPKELSSPAERSGSQHVFTLATVLQRMQQPHTGSAARPAARSPSASSNKGLELGSPSDADERRL